MSPFFWIIIWEMADNVTDVRIQVTRRLIEDSLLSLLNEGIPLNKIGVTELSERAGINRTTFYKHFVDVQDAFRAIEERLCSFVLESVLSASKDGSINIVPVSLFEFIDKNQNVALLILSSNEHGSFLDRVFEEIKKLYFVNIPDDKREKADVLYSFVFGGAKEIVYRWLSSGKKESPKKIAKTIEGFGYSLLKDWR